MAEFVDYAKLYLQGMTAKNTGDQALYSKRLLEYTMAKDSGEKELKELLNRWKYEDSQMAEQRGKVKKIITFLLVSFGILAIIYIIIELYFAFAVSW